MRPAVNLLQAFDANVSVDLRRIQSSVTKEHLQRSQVRAVLHHQRSGRVAKKMASTTLLDPDADQVITNDL